MSLQPTEADASAAPSTDSSTTQLSTSDTSAPLSTGCSQITVMQTSNGERRMWDKKHFCYYCDKPQSKMTRHLETVHGKEPEVAGASLEVDAEKRKIRFMKLRNIGDHRHNVEVLKKGEGSLLVGYRPPNKSADPKAYGPCINCYGYYIRKDLWRHRCPFTKEKKNSGEKDPNPRHGRIAHQSSQLLPGPAGNNTHFSAVLAAMKPDMVSRVVKSDDLILQLGTRESFKAGRDSDKQNHVRTKLREIARLLIQLRTNENQPSASLESFLVPQKYQVIIKAVWDLCGYDENNSTFSIPSLAIKIGHTLRYLSTILRNKELEKMDIAKADLHKAFSELCCASWATDVSAHAYTTLYQAKRNNPTTLPTNDDVVTLSLYLKKVSAEQMVLLSDDELGLEQKKSAWNTLNETTLTEAILFNRRRQGEVSKMKISDLEKKRKTNPDPSCGLSTLERNLCRIFEVVEVVGKRGRTVPVLLTPQMVSQLSTLQELRRAVGVDSNNVFVFARSFYGSDGHIRGSDCFRKHAELAGCVAPGNLRTTKLRKQIATAAQVMTLKENEFELLANFMGHDPKVHRQYYQLPDDVQRVAKLSKLLLVMEKGKLGNQQGKSLDEMSIEDSEGTLEKKYLPYSP